MKAVRLHELEGPDELVYEDVPEPEPGPGETVVRLRAAALNRRDLFATQGQYPGVTPDILPRIPGSDGSGEVAARGEGAQGPDEGTEVVINPALYWGDDPRVPGKEYRILGIPDDGTFAQFIKVPADHVFPKPSHLSHQEAAALPLAALTAYRALVTRGGVAEGETVLVPGIDEKIEDSKELGAEGGVNYNSEDWSRELKSMAGGVDLSADHVGGENFNALVSLAKPGGRIVVIGATAGPTSKAMTIRIALKQLDVLGTAMGTAEEFGAMLDLYAEHGLHPKVNETFALEDTASALHLMEEGSGIGKIVLDVPA
jgi:NADPH:quinone reductase-like Zn-dependent oxidoreductase